MTLRPFRRRPAAAAAALAATLALAFAIPAPALAQASAVPVVEAIDPGPGLLGPGATPALGVLFIPSVIPKDGSGKELAGPQILTNSLGAGLYLPIGPVFGFEPGFDFYYFHHVWIEEAGRAAPTDEAWRTTFTLGFLVSLPLSASWRITRNFDLALGLGPAFHLRLGLLAAGVAESEPADVAHVPLINAFFYEGGRWFVPTSFLRGEYRLTDRVDFGFSARAFWPVYNAWNGAPAGSWWDEGVFGGALVVRYRFPAAAGR